MTERRPRLRPVPPELADKLGWAPESDERAALVDALEQAMRRLPDAERDAALVAFGLDEGVPGVAMEQSLSREDAEALTRSAVQLLRAALSRES